LLLGVRWLKTDVSGLPIGHIFKDQVSCWTAWSLNTGPVCSPETSVLNHLTPRNNQENGIIYFTHGRSLRSHMLVIYLRQSVDRKLASVRYCTMGWTVPTMNLLYREGSQTKACFPPFCEGSMICIVQCTPAGKETVWNCVKLLCTVW
jgi:hypothetical protein